MTNEKDCWPKGLKRTKQRESVLAILKESTQPMSAQEISARISKEGGGAWLSTVYRVLELFVEKKLAIKTSIMNSETAVYELNREHHRHYAVCIGCHKMIPMENCPMESFIPKIKDKEFQVIGHNLEVYGYCKDCAAKK